MPLATLLLAGKTEGLGEMEKRFFFTTFVFLGIFLALTAFALTRNLAVATAYFLAAVLLGFIVGLFDGEFSQERQ